jgi:hypothetical protein
MLGYITNNNDYFKGDIFQYNLKKSVAFSGGSQKEYEFFKSLLTYSIYNKSERMPLHDVRAAQFLLHLFPIKIQVVISLLLYFYEKNLIEEFKDYELNTDNILLPSEQIKFNNIINRYKISYDLLFIVDNIAEQNNTMSDVGLCQLKQIMNIQFTVNDLNGTLLQNIEKVLTKFRVSNILKSQYTQIVKDNDRLQAGIITARKLDYKLQSIQYFTEAVSIWHRNLDN